MPAYVPKGKIVFISTLPAPAGVAITGVSKAVEAVLTITNTAAVGDFIVVQGTGYASLDGGGFEITAVTGTTVTITADTSKETGTATPGTGYIYNEATNMVETCFDNFAYNREAGQTITAGTFCGTTTLTGQAGAHTWEFSGFDDPESAGMAELIQAQKDGIPRLLVYNYPTAASATGKAHKFIVPAAVVAGFNGPVANAGAAATFSGSGTANGDPTYT